MHILYDLLKPWKIDYNENSTHKNKQHENFQNYGTLLIIRVDTILNGRDSTLLFLVHCVRIGFKNPCLHTFWGWNLWGLCSQFGDCCAKLRYEVCAGQIRDRPCNTCMSIYTCSSLTKEEQGTLGPPWLAKNEGEEGHPGPFSSSIERTVSLGMQPTNQCQPSYNQKLAQANTWYSTSSQRSKLSLTLQRGHF